MFSCLFWVENRIQKSLKQFLPLNREMNENWKQLINDSEEIFVTSKFFNVFPIGKRSKRKSSLKV